MVGEVAMKSPYQELKEQAWVANMEIPARGLAVYTFGNVSAVDRGRAVFAIKPSGVDYAKLGPADLVVVDLEGKVVEGSLRPSSDTRTHLVLTRAESGPSAQLFTWSAAGPTPFASGERS